MQLKQWGLVVLGCLGVVMTAQANEVLLTANQPMQVSYQLAHQNKNGQPVLGATQSIKLDKNTVITVPLANFDRAGVVITSVDGHVIPSEFNKPEQCAMTTDKVRTSGVLALTMSAHSASCQTFGGVFG